MVLGFVPVWCELMMNACMHATLRRTAIFVLAADGLQAEQPILVGFGSCVRAYLLSKRAFSFFSFLLMEYLFRT